VIFDPVIAGTTDAAFGDLEFGAEVSIAGVDIYALFAVQDLYYGEMFWYGSSSYTEPMGNIGTGFALGGIGTAGDIRIGAEVTWNLYPSLWFVFLYGLNGAVTDWTNQYCTSDVWYPYWILGGMGIIQTGCDVVFSYLTVVAQFPICCADVYVMAEFSCDGFDYLSFLARNIDIGLDWLQLWGLGITYSVNSKDIAFDFQVTTGDIVCFKPYFTVVTDGFDASTGENQGFFLDGITLNALTLSCTLGGCEFIWGHIFDPMMMRFTGWMFETWGGPYLDDYHFNAVGGGISRSPTACMFRVGGATVTTVSATGTTTANAYYYPNEMLTIQCDEDSCCGGLFSFSVNNFFMTEIWLPETTVGDDPLNPTYGSTWSANHTLAQLTGLFGWFGSYIELSAGIGSNVSIVTGLKVTALNGTEQIKFGLKVVW
jgi:hypothetical protein